MHKPSPHPENADDRLCRARCRSRPLEHQDDRRTANTSIRGRTAAPATGHATAPSQRSHRRRNRCVGERGAEPSFEGDDGILYHMVAIAIVLPVDEAADFLKADPVEGYFQIFLILLAVLAG